MLTSGRRRSVDNSSSSRSTAGLNMSIDSSSTETEPAPLAEKVRVLALHGSEGNGLHFSTSLYPLRDQLLLQKTSDTDNCNNNNNKKVDLQIYSPSGPFEKGRGFCWWRMAEGARSFTADEYMGVQESEEVVLKAFKVIPPDLVVAHSQGAILMAALLAQNKIPYHPSKGYILNGVAWPNPYGKELLDVSFIDTTTTTTASDDHEAPPSPPPPPRVLFVMGEQDTINPLSSAKQVQEAFEKSGCHVTVHTHDGGHSIPNDEASIKAMADWVLSAGATPPLPPPSL